MNLESSIVNRQILQDLFPESKFHRIVTNLKVTSYVFSYTAKPMNFKIHFNYRSEEVDGKTVKHITSVRAVEDCGSPDVIFNDVVQLHQLPPIIMLLKTQKGPFDTHKHG